MAPTFQVAEMEYSSCGRWFRLREKKRPHNYFCSSGKMWGSDAGDGSWWAISMEASPSPGLSPGLSPLANELPASNFPTGYFRLQSCAISLAGPQVWCSSCKMWGLDAGIDSWWECVTYEPEGENGKYFRLREKKHPQNYFCSSIMMWGADAGIDSWWEMEYGSSGRWFRLREKKHPHNYFCTNGKIGKMFGSRPGEKSGDGSWWAISMEASPSPAKPPPKPPGLSPLAIYLLTHKPKPHGPTGSPEAPGPSEAHDPT